MDVDDDDDFYGAEEGAQPSAEEAPKTEKVPEPAVKPKNEDEDLEEGEEEDEEESSDSDIDIITERKDGAPPPAIYNKPLPQRNATAESISKTAALKKESPARESPAPTIKSSAKKIDVDAKPIYPPAGKPITQVNIDEDLPENDKPWRRPGADVSDFFNYGFDEFTWTLYAQKQEQIKSESQNSKKMFEDMSMMFGGMGGMTLPGMAGGVEGMPPEMQQMMQQMMASGMDPSQMDPSMFGGAGGAQPGNAGFGAQAGFGQGQNAYGYDQGGSGNRGGNFGRGRGGRRGGW